MRTTKKLLSLLLALCMVVSLLPATALAVEGTADAAVWDGTVDTKWYTDHENDSAYTIDSAEELAGLAKLVNEGTTNFSGKTVQLGADIDLGGKEWTPIGKPKNVFQGTFDGNKKTISNLSINTPNKHYIGLFGACTGNATLQNFNLHNVNIRGSQNVAAVLGGNGNAEAKITNVHVTGSVQIEGYWYVGGILGKGYTTVTNCSVEGDGKDTSSVSITGGYVGGIVGFMGEGNCQTLNCTVKNLTVKGEYNGIGGINGILQSGNTISNCTVENVVVWQTAEPESNGRIFVGAFAGTYRSESTLSSCEFTGEIYSGAAKNDVLEENRYTGSLWYGDNPPAKLNVENCTIHMPPVAQIGTQPYETLADAVAAANDGETITLLRDVTANITVPADKNITLDLNGKVLTGALNEQGINVLDTIKVDGGSLTVKDSTAGQPVVDAGMNVTYQSGAVKNIAPTVKPYTQAISVVNGGKLVLENGTIYSEDSDGIYVSGEGSSLTMNGGYVYSNDNGYGIGGNVKATLNIHGGVVVADDNAAVGGNGSLGQGDTTFNITGGTMIGHMSDTARANGYIACGVYHPQAGTLNISGGTIYADRGVGVEMRGGTLNMTGGSVIATGNDSGKVGDSKVAANCYGIQIDGDSNYYDYGNCKVNISGNTFVKSDNGVPCVIVTPEDGQKKMTITGGLFSSDPSDYCAEGMTGVTNTDSATQKDYPFMIAVKEETAAVPVPAEPEVKNPAADQGTEEDKALAAGAAAALKPTDENSPTPAITGGALDAAVNTLANQNTTTEEQASEALKKENISIDGNVTVTVAVQHYMDITITEAKAQADETTKSLTLNIKPMAQKVATTANLATGEGIIIKPETQKNVNAVKIGDPVELNVTGPVTVALPLPTDFAPQGTTTLYVKHTADNGRTYYYTGTVENNVLTFTNPHGFSLFTISATNEAVAEVNGVGYPTLQAAVDAVENNGTIKLLKDGETATVSRTVKFTVEPDNKTYTITAGANTTVTNEGHKYTCVYTAPTYTGPSGYAVKTEVGAHGKLTVSMVILK